MARAKESKEYSTNLFSLGGDHLWIGISGWTFAPWRGKFYPKGLVQKRELEYASRQLNSIEVNGTFYGLQRPKSFLSWAEQTPEDFVFALKAPQFITHVKRLKEVREPLATFLGSGPLCLSKKLGPILWQFPPHVTLKDDRFKIFFEMLPHTAQAAAKLAREHGRGKGELSFTEPVDDFPVRHAFEFRHPSFLDAKFMDLARAHQVAIVFGHTGKAYTEEPTSDFVYARMHGEGKGFGKGYTTSMLAEWAKKIREWSKTRDVFIYFDCDKKVYAPSNALKLTQLLRGEKPK